MLRKDLLDSKVFMVFTRIKCITQTEEVKSKTRKKNTFE